MTRFFAGDPVAASDLNAIDLTEPLTCIVKASGTPAVSIATGGGPVAFNTDVLDPQGWHDPVTNNTRITPTVAGWYFIVGNVQLAASSGGTNPRRWAAVRVNGGTQYFGQVTPAGTPNMGAQVVIDGLQLNGTTDYVELMAGQDSGSAVAIGDYGSTRFSCRLMWQ